MKKRNILYALLSFMMIFGYGCSPEGAEEAEQDTGSNPTEGTELVASEDGTYNVTKDGHNGPLEIAVTFNSGEIEEIELVDHVETIAIGDGAFDTIREEVLEHQSVNVDTVSGATITSHAIIGAIKDAIEEAGGDLATYENEIEMRSAEDAEWSADVLVIGSGAAGLSAGIQAAENGLDVIVLEKQGVYGGTTARSEGIIQASGTELQANQDIEDNPELMFEGLQEVIDDTPEVDLDLVEKTAQESADHILWLEELGIEFEEEVTAPHIYEPRNVPREHTALGLGGGLIQGMIDAAEELGVELHLNTAATEIIQNDNGEVVGVKATNQYGDDITINANAVVLAAGGYPSNEELMAELNPNVENYTSGNSTEGDGYTLAESVDADMIVRPDALYHFTYQLPASIPNPSAIGFFNPELLMVTPDGERYADEASYTFDRTYAVTDKGYDHAYAVVDEEFYNEYKDLIDAGIENDLAWTSDSALELAELTGEIDPATLEATVNEYNEFCVNGEDTEFNKPSEYLDELEGDLYVLYLTPSIAETFNGARINENAQIIASNGEPIPGFYGAGASAMAQMTSQRYFGSGTAILNAITYGREAANHIADNN